MPKTIYILQRGRDNEKFMSPWTNLQACDRLRKHQARNPKLQNDFVDTLLIKADQGKAVDNQWAWIHKIVLEQDGELPPDPKRQLNGEPKMKVRPTHDDKARARGRLQGAMIGVVGFTPKTSIPRIRLRVTDDKAQQVATALVNLFGFFPARDSVQAILGEGLCKPDKLALWHQVYEALDTVRWVDVTTSQEKS